MRTRRIARYPSLLTLACFLGLPAVSGALLRLRMAVAFLVVLLDPRALVIDVERGDHARRQDAGPKAARVCLVM
jgi:hypothetical protein